MEVRDKPKVEADTSRIQPQSVVNSSVFQGSSSLNAENVTFRDLNEHPHYSVDSVVDETRTLLDSNDAELGNFMNRPLKIKEYQWNVGTGIDVQFNPWDEFFTNPRISNRICNYNLLRCKLRLKIVINGNGFHYGRAICSYLPFDVWDTLSQVTGDAAHIVQASQLPHVYLDPTTSMGGELTLPFFSYINYLSIPDEGWGDMGTIYLRSLNDLKHGNGAVDKVTISIFAMAEDVAMTVLTSREPASIAPQSMATPKETDETNKEGIVSGPATTVARIATSLSTVPGIGPFATATMMAANTTAGIAKLFGYCRPAENRAPASMRPLANSALAVTNTGDTLQKLTLDANQELSIDTRIAGLGGDDEMTISGIAARESYVTKFTWSTATNPETLLWNTGVTPVTWAESAAGSYNFPACAMAAIPFKYWTGTLKYRFQFVCSSHHKGRVKFVYDPGYQKTNEYNTNYTLVMDLAETTDFTVTIGVGQEVTFMRHGYPGVDSASDIYGTTAYTSVTRPEGNGVLSAYVVNELTTPNSTVNNDIEVNVFISAGDDFEVAVPDDWFSRFVFKPQSVATYRIMPQSMAGPDETDTKDPSAPIQTDELALTTQYTANDKLNKVFFGEVIASFRTILRRYAQHSSLGDLGSKLVYGRRPNFPYLRGNVSGAVNSTVAAAPYSYCNTLLLHWVTMAFSGYRGSIRYKLLPLNIGDERDAIDYWIARSSANPGDPMYSSGTTTTLTYGSDVDASVIWMPQADPTLPTSWSSGINGLVYQNGRVNQACEFEVPYYSPFRFTPGKKENHTGTAIFDDAWDYRMQMKGNNAAQMPIFVAAGEDFQCYMFTGLPPMYFESQAPV